LANVQKITVRRLIGLTSLVVMLSAVYFVAYGAGAVVNCGAVAICAGTNGDDVITTTAASDKVIYGLGGDDSITEAFGPATAGLQILIFGGAGDDTVTTTDAGGGPYAIYGEDGNDYINVTTTPAGGDTTVVEGGRGNDSIIGPPVGPLAFFTVSDGPGRDTIILNSNGPGGAGVNTVLLAGDNEPDTVRTPTQVTGVTTVILNQNSGRDVIVCPAGGGAETIFLKGNTKAVDKFGNNLRQAALLGGGTGDCETIIP